MLTIGDAQPGALVSFVTQGIAIPLSEQDQLQVGERVRALIIGCGMNSVSSPGVFAGRALPDEWREVRAGSHLYVRFPEPLQTQRGAVQISEVAIGFQDPRFIGPELTRYGDEVVGHVKCDGHRSLALMCAPALRPHLLPGQSATCPVYDRIGDPR
jgi:hypothetical protein